MRTLNIILIIFTIFIFNFPVNAANQIYTIQNNITDFNFEVENNFTRINFESNSAIVKNFIPGHPEIPVIIYKLIIPENQTISSIEVINYIETELSGNFNIYPVQKLFVIGETKTFTIPETNIYNSDQIYPSRLVKHTHTGNFSGHRIASILVYPVRYNPVKQKLYFYDEIVFQITYSYNNKALVKPERLFQFDIDRINKVIKKMVENPEDILANKPYIEEQKLDQGIEVTNAPSAQGLGVRYLIITSDALANSFESLKEWKNKTGVTAEIRSLEWIKANVNPGVDDAETIRNFIKWAYQKWGTQYVLLGGDADIIPTRFVFTNDLTVSTDMYYSDLAGN